MDEIGVVIKAVGGKCLIKLKKLPGKIPKVLFDSDKKEVGNLLDVIGPVENPIGNVLAKESTDLIGKHLYTL